MGGEPPSVQRAKYHGLYPRTDEKGRLFYQARDASIMQVHQGRGWRLRAGIGESWHKTLYDAVSAYIEWSGGGLATVIKNIGEPHNG